MNIQLNVNGTVREVEIDPEAYLVDVLRKLGCYSVRRGCQTGMCGLCTVLVDEKPVLSCSTLAVRAVGKKVTTIEGIPDQVRQFADYLASECADQCGYCAPGFILTVIAMKKELKNPTKEEIRHYLNGNLCRCTGYMSQMRAVCKYMGIASEEKDQNRFDFHDQIYAAIIFDEQHSGEKDGNLKSLEIILENHKKVTVYYGDKPEQLETVAGKSLEMPVAAYPDENERQCILTDNVNLFEIKYAAAKMADVLSTKIRVIHNEKGIAEDRDIDAEICAAVLSKKAGRPVYILKEQKSHAAYDMWEEENEILSVTVRLEEDGSYLVLTSSVCGCREQYQKLKESAARYLHTSAEKITLQMGDTDYPYSANITSDNIERIFETVICKAAVELHRKIFHEVRIRWKDPDAELAVNDSCVYKVDAPEQSIELKKIGIESMFGTKKILSANAAVVEKK